MNDREALSMMYEIVTTVTDRSRNRIRYFFIALNSFTGIRESGRPKDRCYEL
jgi:hypothetical protein